MRREIYLAGNYKSFSFSTSAFIAAFSASSNTNVLSDSTFLGPDKSLKTKGYYTEYRIFFPLIQNM